MNIVSWRSYIEEEVKILLSSGANVYDKNNVSDVEILRFLHVIHCLLILLLLLLLLLFG